MGRKSSKLYVGMDVHKESVDIAVARIQRERANAAVVVDIAARVRCHITDASDTAVPRRSLQSTGR